jgi:hypothetical protein
MALGRPVGQVYVTPLIPLLEPLPLPLDELSLPLLPELPPLLDAPLLDTPDEPPLLLLELLPLDDDPLSADPLVLPPELVPVWGLLPSPQELSPSLHPAVSATTSGAVQTRACLMVRSPSYFASKTAKSCAIREKLGGAA